MKVLKWIFIVIVAIIAIFLIYSASQPNQLALEESILINAPQKQVFAEITDFRKWENWSPWDAMDPEMKQEYSETMGEVGSFNQWWSTNPMVGNGRQDIIEITSPDYMKVMMTFEGMEDNSYAVFNLSQENGMTKVVWSFESYETPFYLNFMNTMMEPMIKDNYQTGLKNLKSYIEEMPAAVEVPNPYNLEMVETSPQDIVSIMDSTTGDGISDKLGELYQELIMHLATTEGADQAGMPLAFYYNYSVDKVVLEAAIPYSGEVEAKGRVQVKETPSGKAIKGIYIGDYEGSEEMHTGIGGYIAAKGMEISGPCWEVYANDPMEVDASEIETHIYYPVQ